MCGICGFSGAQKPTILKNMTSTLQHRGPDDSGYWMSHQGSMGFRRLSILDIAHGKQPVISADNMVMSVFNGEIYNHQHLRKQLSDLGYQFKSGHSDAELIPYLYQEYGADFPTHIIGMFAIAIYDKTLDKWLLYRDHAGIKPLYYSLLGEALVFGSEIKALLVHPDVSRKPDYEAIYHYFTFKNIPSPFSAFADIRQLQPGEELTYQKGRAELRKWWRLPDSKLICCPEDAARQLRSLLEDSVELQAQADVDVGAYLSGGVDSSAVVALMSQKASKPIKTFTLAYEDAFSNKEADRKSAQKIAQMYGTEHYELLLSEKVFWSAIDDIVSAFDEPFSGVNSTYFLTKLISKHVKVALSGDGADELFGSYLPHRIALPMSQYESLNVTQRSAWQHLEFAASYLENLLQKGDISSRRMAQLLWDDQQKHSIFSKDFANHARKYSSLRLVRDHYQESQTRQPLTQALYFDFQTMLPDQVLTFSDRLSMAHSVEVRPPFLDHRIIELAFSIADNLKIHNGSVKWILKEAVADLLPVEILNRPKEGFVPPVNQWLKRDGYNKINEYVDPVEIKKSGILDYQVVMKIAKQAKSGDHSSLLRLWNVMMFCAWSKVYLCN